MVKSIMEHLRSLSAKHRKQVDKGKLMVDKMKRQNEAARKATQEPEGGTE